MTDANRQFLRHTIATAAYRATRALQDAPAGLADFQAPGGVRTPAQILAHMGDLFDWALSMAEGKQRWHDSTPLPWEEEVARFFSALKTFDDFLASDKPLLAPPERLFQGPVADALNHVGQIAILRRMAATPIRGENYFIAGIASGCVGPDQPAPKRQFD